MMEWTADQLLVIESFRQRNLRGEVWTFDELATALAIPVERLTALYEKTCADFGIIVRAVGRVN